MKPTQFDSLDAIKQITQVYAIKFGWIYACLSVPVHLHWFYYHISSIYLPLSLTHTFSVPILM